jgi:hypothetical protein
MAASNASASQWICVVYVLERLSIESVVAALPLEKSLRIGQFEASVPQGCFEENALRGGFLAVNPTRTQ